MSCEGRQNRRTQSSKFAKLFIHASRRIKWITTAHTQTHTTRWMLMMDGFVFHRDCGPRHDKQAIEADRWWGVRRRELVLEVGSVWSMLLVLYFEHNTHSWAILHTAQSSYSSAPLLFPEIKRTYSRTRKESSVIDTGYIYIRTWYKILVVFVHCIFFLFDWIGVLSVDLNRVV